MALACCELIYVSWSKFLKFVVAWWRHVDQHSLLPRDRKWQHISRDLIGHFSKWHRIYGSLFKINIAVTRFRWNIMRPGKSQQKHINFIISLTQFLQNHVYFPCHERPHVSRVHVIRGRFIRVSLYQTASCFTRWYPGHLHDDVMKWKHYPYYWPFVRVIHRLPLDSPHMGPVQVMVMVCRWSVPIHHLRQYWIIVIWQQNSIEIFCVKKMHWKYFIWNVLPSPQLVTLPTNLIRSYINIKMGIAFTSVGLQPDDAICRDSYEVPVTYGVVFHNFQIVKES